MGIFDAQVKDKLFTRYHATIQLRDKLMGGTPRDPKAIQGWLKTRTKLTQDDDLIAMTLRTLREMGRDIPDHITSLAELDALVDDVAAIKSTNGFKQNGVGLYIEGRTIKAMLKESVSILYTKQQWSYGRGEKAATSIAAERVFVEPEVIPLGRKAPDDIDLQISHVMTPKGPKSSLTYVEYVVQPRIVFDVLVTGDVITEDDWARVWVQAQENGLGARRSQGYGKFDVLGWEKMNGRELKQAS